MIKVIFLFLGLIFSAQSFSLTPYKGSYDLYAETVMGNLKIGTAILNLEVNNNQFKFTTDAKTESLWKALYDYSRTEKSIGNEIDGQIMIVRLNRPERLNALSTVIRNGMAEAFNRYHEDNDLEVAILTGTGRGFCAGEDMKESIDRGIPGSPKEFVEENLVDPFQKGILLHR